MVQTNYKQRGTMVKKSIKEDDKEKKEKKITLKEIFGKKMKERLNKHSKNHKGGMEGSHMKNMVKFIKRGMSFEEAHIKSLAADKKKKEMPQKKKEPTRY